MRLIRSISNCTTILFLAATAVLWVPAVTTYEWFFGRDQWWKDVVGGKVWIFG